MDLINTEEFSKKKIMESDTHFAFMYTPSTEETILDMGSKLQADGIAQSLINCVKNTVIQYMDYDDPRVAEEGDRIRTDIMAVLDCNEFWEDIPQIEQIRRD